MRTSFYGVYDPHHRSEPPTSVLNICSYIHFASPPWRTESDSLTVPFSVIRLFLILISQTSVSFAGYGVSKEGVKFPFVTGQ